MKSSYFQTMTHSNTRNVKVSSNYLRQFRDSDSLEIQKLSAVQFMNVWEHYDADGEFWEHYDANVWEHYDELGMFGNILMLMVRFGVKNGDMVSCSTSMDETRNIGN